MRLPEERNWDRQTNPLRLKQMTVSVYSSSIVHTTRALSANTQVRSDPIARSKSHRPKKNKSTSLCIILIVTFQERCRSDVGGNWRCLNYDASFATASQWFQDPANKLGRNRGASGCYDRRFCFTWDDQRVVFHHWLQAVFENIGFWHGAHILVRFIVPYLSEYCGMTDLQEECSPPCFVQ